MPFLPPPSFEIPRPPIEPPLHGLLDVAYIPDLSGLSEAERERWTAGITFSPNPSTCDDSVVPWIPWTDDPADKAGPGATLPDEVYHSIVLTYTSVCQALPPQLDARIDAALQAMEAGTSQAVESLFWGPTGDEFEDIFAPTGPNFSLSGSTPLVTGYTDDSCSGILNRNPVSSGITALTPKQALLALTQALGNCGLGARGVIHAPVYLAEDWAGQNLIRNETEDADSKLITNVRGDYIVGGSGYTGRGPAGHPYETPQDGFAWAYATGPVGVLLSEPTHKETTLVDNRTNLHRIIVERTVAIAASSSCLYAAYVDVS